MSCSEWKKRGVHFHHFGFDAAALSFLTLVSDGRLSMTQAEKFDPLRAMLICSIIWLGKADVAGCCSAGSVLR